MLLKFNVGMSKLNSETFSVLWTCIQLGITSVVEAGVLILKMFSTFLAMLGTDSTHCLLSSAIYLIMFFHWRTTHKCV